VYLEMASSANCLQVVCIEGEGWIVVDLHNVMELEIVFGPTQFAAILDEIRA
jgi:hypothetical protein